MKPYVPILATVLLIGLGHAQAQDATGTTAAPKSMLRLMLTEGATHYHTMTISSDMTMDLPNGEMKLKMDQQMSLLTWKP